MNKVSEAELDAATPLTDSAERDWEEGQRQPNPLLDDSGSDCERVSSSEREDDGAGTGLWLQPTRPSTDRPRSSTVSSDCGSLTTIGLGDSSASSRSQQPPLNSPDSGADGEAGPVDTESRWQALLDLRREELYDLRTKTGSQLSFAHVVTTAAFSCYNIVFTKIVGELLSHEFPSELLKPHVYMFLGCLVFSNTLQVIWLNRCLKRFPALFVIPALQVAQLLYTVIGGGVYFNEFQSFSGVQWILFPIGLAGCIGGVVLLSKREAAEALIDLAESLPQTVSAEGSAGAETNKKSAGGDESSGWGGYSESAYRSSVEVPGAKQEERSVHKYSVFAGGSWVVSDRCLCVQSGGRTEPVERECAAIALNPERRGGAAAAECFDASVGESDQQVDVDGRGGGGADLRVGWGKFTSHNMSSFVITSWACSDRLNVIAGCCGVTGVGSRLQSGEQSGDADGFGRGRCYAAAAAAVAVFLAAGEGADALVMCAR